jgi:pyruvate dehydrogenase E2 component (dihydrolipoamide acetyltransferase)
MATPIIMPKFGMTQTEATVVRWLVQEGQTVQTGDPLLEVETDKVNMEVESPASGILSGISVQEGQVVPVTDTIGYILQAGETLPTAATAQPEARRVTPVAARVAAAAGVDLAQVPAADAAGRVTRRDVEAFLAKPRATPAARRVARQGGVELASVAGSGPEGRIQAADVAAVVQAQQQAGKPAVAQPAADKTIALQGMRRTIARRMTESYQSAPHITLTVEADMTAAEALRAELNALSEKQKGPRVSVTAILVRVCAWALRRHPLVNAALHGEVIHLHEQANVGVAVALDEGLIVPVMHGVERLGVSEIVRQLDDLSQRARQGRLTPDDVSAGTFTVTNLGMFGVKHFTAIINPPEAAILAVGAIVKRAVVDQATDAVRVRPIMEMTLSADHRVLDGATAARFLADVVSGLEHPALLLW